jgi:hypothetical protein
MSLRKYGALRYGLIFASIVAASNQTLTVEPVSVAVSAPSAQLSNGPGVANHVLFQRPVFQRGIRFFGPSSYSSTPGTGSTSLAAGTQVVTITAPAATLTPGSVSLAAGGQVVVVTAPDATRTAGGVSLAAGGQTIAITAPAVNGTGGGSSLAAGEQVVTITAPTATLSSSATLAAGAQTVTITAPDATLTAGGSSLAAGAQVVTVTAPDATLSAPGAAGVPNPVHFRRPVFQRGLYWFGPVSVSATPEADQTLQAGEQFVTVTAPTATLSVSGGASTSAVVVKFRFVRARQLPARAKWVAAHGTIEEVNQVVSAGAQVVTVTAPTATISSGAAGAAYEVTPQLKRVRQKVSGFAAARPARVLRHGRAVMTPPGAGQGLTASAQTITVVAPTATLTAGASSQAAGAQIVTVVAPTATLAAGAASLAAGANTVTVIAPAVTVSLATIRAAGEQTIAIVAPDVTLTAGSVTLAAGEQIVTVTAPTASANSGISRAAGEQSIAISAPIATLTVGTALVQAGSMTVAVSAPSVTVLGATTLPEFDDAYLVSRNPIRTLASRGPERTLAAHEPNHIVRFDG